MGPLRYIPLGFQQITSLGSAVGLTLPVPPTGDPAATVAVITVDAASVRWRDDGTAPTASVGMTIRDTDAPFEYWGDLSAIELIAVSGSPIVNVSYYRIAG